MDVDLSGITRIYNVNDCSLDAMEQPDNRYITDGAHMTLEQNLLIVELGPSESRPLFLREKTTTVITAMTSLLKRWPPMPT